MPKLDNSIETNLRANLKNLKTADIHSAEVNDVKFIKKIQAPTTASSEAKPANRPPRMGGCIPVSG